jgi:hypothetical protein
LGRSHGEAAYLLRDHGKARAGLAGPSRFDGGIEGQEVGLEGDLIKDTTALKTMPAV